MKRVLRRIGLALLLVVVVLLVVRQIVVPLARQRQERRQLDPTLIALLPAGTEAWILRRGPLRQPTDALWPEGVGRVEERLSEWSIPIASLRENLSLGRLAGGPWLAASLEGGDWIFAGRRTRLPWGTALGERLTASPDSLLTLPDGVLGLSGPFFLVASRPELFDAGSWLAGLPEWGEIGDLLVGSDQLEYRACAGGGALLGVKPILGVLLAEGLTWGCPAGLDALAALAPGRDPPAASAADERTLADLPGLRRGAPFDPEGFPLSRVGSGLLSEPGLRLGERRWEGAGNAALCRVLARPSP